MNKSRLPAIVLLMKNATPRRIVTLAALAAVLSCGGSAVPEEKRTVISEENGYRFVLPLKWAYWGSEMLSQMGSLFTIQIHSLEDSSKEFVAGLPHSVIPRFETEASTVFGEVSMSAVRETTVGGVAGIEVEFPVRVRPSDPLSKLNLWVIRRGEKLFVLRASYPADKIALDEPAVRTLLASWRFLGGP